MLSPPQAGFTELNTTPGLSLSSGGSSEMLDTASPEFFTKTLASVNIKPSMWQQKTPLIRSLLHTANRSWRLLTVRQTTLVFTASLALI